MYYVVSDMKLKYHDAFVCSKDELDEVLGNYSGYFFVVNFSTEEEAEKYCTDYNNYEGEPNEQLSCCSSGCTMSAWEYAHWNGKCAYMGE